MITELNTSEYSTESQRAELRALADVLTDEQQDLLELFATIAQFDLEDDLKPTIKKWLHDLKDEPERGKVYQLIGNHTIDLVDEWFNERITSTFSTAKKEVYYYALTSDYSIKTSGACQAWLGAEMIWRYELI